MTQYEQMLSNYNAWRATQHLVDGNSEWKVITPEKQAKRNNAWNVYVSSREAFEQAQREAKVLQ